MQQASTPRDEATTGSKHTREQSDDREPFTAQSNENPAKVANEPRLAEISRRDVSKVVQDAEKVANRRGVSELFGKVHSFLDPRDTENARTSCRYTEEKASLSKEPSQIVEIPEDSDANWKFKEIKVTERRGWGDGAAGAKVLKVTEDYDAYTKVEEKESARCVDESKKGIAAEKSIQESSEIEKKWQFLDKVA